MNSKIIRKRTILFLMIIISLLLFLPSICALSLDNFSVKKLTIDEGKSTKTDSGSNLDSESIDETLFNELFDENYFDELNEVLIDFPDDEMSEDNSEYNDEEQNISSEEKPKQEEKKDYIKWVSFDVPFSALEKAMQIDIKAHKDGERVDWIELLALTATKLYGNWKNYKHKDMQNIATKLLKGEKYEELKDSKTYKYFFEAYSAILSPYLGEYTIEAPDPSDSKKTIHVSKYGLRVFSPIAYGYGFSHYDDFGASRSFGYKRRHLGHDIMGRVGTPIIAIESGTIEELGWNRYGGWRIGIRSFDKKRYYYYAHLRKGKPFPESLSKGEAVMAGDVIGYLGMSGYSQKEDTNNINVPHLHLGLQLIFDESQKEGAKEIWVDVYGLTRLLAKNRSRVRFDSDTKDYVRKYNFVL